MNQAWWGHSGSPFKLAPWNKTTEEKDGDVEKDGDAGVIMQGVTYAADAPAPVELRCVPPKPRTLVYSKTKESGCDRARRVEVRSIESTTLQLLQNDCFRDPDCCNFWTVG